MRIVNPSLRLRLFLAHAFVALVAITTVTALQMRASRRELLRHNADALEHVARQAARFIVDDAAARRGAWQVAAMVRDSTTGLRFTLIQRNGVVLADTRADALEMENHAERPEVRAALQGRVGSAVRRSTTLGIEMQYVAVPAVPGEPFAVLRVAEPLESVYRLDHALRGHSILVAACTLLAFLVVLFLLTARQLRRVRDLEVVASRAGSGDIAARALELPDDELGRLGAAFNRMSEAIHEQLVSLANERDTREHILAHMTDGVALVDPDGRIRHCNTSLVAILEADHAPAPGVPFAAFVRSPELDDLVVRARDTGLPQWLDARLWTPRPRSVRASATPLGDRGEGAVLLVLHDMSEVEAAHRVRQDFVANVSHELRTPLTSLRGYAETLLDGALEDREHATQFVQIIRAQAERLQALVDDLLSLAELERPDAEFQATRYDLHIAVERQVAAFADAARRAHLSLVFEPSAPVWVLAEGPRLEQVVANLLDNAIKYTEAGVVTVRIGEDATMGWCEVSDTGPGIDAEELPRVFERFYRIDKARSREKGGTGLGLSIVKHIVGLHGGEVSVRSEPGVGSTFRFEVPRAR